MDLLPFSQLALKQINSGNNLQAIVCAVYYRWEFLVFAWIRPEKRWLAAHHSTYMMVLLLYSVSIQLPDVVVIDLAVFFHSHLEPWSLSPLPRSVFIPPLIHLTPTRPYTLQRGLTDWKQWRCWLGILKRGNIFASGCNSII